MNDSIIITGAAQRLGLAMAEHLLQLSHCVIITYRNKKPSVDMLIKKGAIAIQADFSTAQGIDSFIKTIKGMKLSIRALVHNASDWHSENTNTDHALLMQQMMQIHSVTPYKINLALKNLFTPGADIIHMTDYVQEVGSDKHIAYAASKAALHNLTLSFAKKFAPDVKVNSIAPSLLMFNDADDEQYKQKALQKSLLGICPGAQEAVKAMTYILDSDYLTGQTIHLNGGRHLK